MATERGLEIARKLWGWEPHSQGQREFLLDQAKVKVAACGRRWGKSESMAIDIVLFALEKPGSIQFIVAPTDDQTKIIMEEVSRRFATIPGMKSEVRELRSPYHSITLLDAGRGARGTYIAGRTAGTNGKGLRGHKAHRVVLDEAAFVSDSIDDDVIGPMLADYDGFKVKISTPFGSGHFKRDFLVGKTGDNDRYRSFQFPSALNPHLSASYLEDQRKTKPERTWQQEYEAQFLDDAGGVFRGVDDVIVDAIDLARVDCSQVQHVTLGVDLARIEDFTVISGVDSFGRQCYLERFNQISWERQIGAIVAAYNKFPRAKVMLDCTGVGDPIFEALRKAGVNVEGYQLTNSSKEALIDNLAMKIENQAIAIANVPAQTSELKAYQYELTASRNIRMNAPQGMHDDMVIALALAVWPLRPRNLPSYSEAISLMS